MGRPATRWDRGRRSATPSCSQGRGIGTHTAHQSGAPGRRVDGTPLRHALAVERIAVVGPIASGKTTVAARLGASLGLPVVELDDHYWRHTPRPTDEEWATRHFALIRGDRWVISGDYRSVASVRFQAADMVVWLDLPRSTCLFRATVRKMKGNPAPIGDSWRWIWRYPAHGRLDTASALADPDLTCSVVRLHSSAEVVTFLRQFSPSYRGTRDHRDGD